MNLVDRILTIVITATITSAIWIVAGGSLIENATSASQRGTTRPAEVAPSPETTDQNGANAGGDGETVPATLLDLDAPTASKTGQPRQLVIPVQNIRPSDLSDTYSDSRGDNARLHEAIDINVPISCGDAPVFPGDVVLGDASDVVAVPACLGGYRTHWVEGQDYPMLVPTPGAQADGLILDGLTDTHRARLDFFEGGFGYDLIEVDVTSGGETRKALRFQPDHDARPGVAWRLSDWADLHAPLWVAAAREAMGYFGRITGADTGLVADLGAAGHCPVRTGQGGDVLFGFRPEQVHPDANGPLQMNVTTVERIGARTILHLAAGDMTAKAVLDSETPVPDQSQPFRFALDADDIRLFDAETERAL